MFPIQLYRERHAKMSEAYDALEGELTAKGMDADRELLRHQYASIGSAIRTAIDNYDRAPAATVRTYENQLITAVSEIETAKQTAANLKVDLAARFIQACDAVLEVNQVVALSKPISLG